MIGGVFMEGVVEIEVVLFNVFCEVYLEFGFSDDHQVGIENFNYVRVGFIAYLLLSGLFRIKTMILPTFCIQ